MLPREDVSLTWSRKLLPASWDSAPERSTMKGTVSVPEAKVTFQSFCDVFCWFSSCEIAVDAPRNMIFSLGPIYGFSVFLPFIKAAFGHVPLLGSGGNLKLVELKQSDIMKIQVLTAGTSSMTGWLPNDQIIRGKNLSEACWILRISTSAMEHSSAILQELKGVESIPWPRRPIWVFLFQRLDPSAWNIWHWTGIDPDEKKSWTSNHLIFFDC